MRVLIGGVRRGRRRSRMLICRWRNPGGDVVMCEREELVIIIIMLADLFLKGSGVSVVVVALATICCSC